MKPGPKGDFPVKIRTVSLTEFEDDFIIAVGNGGRTQGIREMIEIYQIVSQLGITEPKELKRKLGILIQDIVETKGRKKA